MSPSELRQHRQALGMSQAELAAALGITANRYQAWETGRNGIPPFLHLALSELQRQTKAKRSRGRNKTPPQGRTLTPSQAQAILNARAGRTKLMVRELAQQYGVSRETIYQIWNGVTWKHLQPSLIEE